MLTTYAMSWVMYRNVMALVARDGMVITTATGAKTAHPMMAVIGRHAELTLRASDRLGMSPAARSRLSLPEDAPPSKFDGLLGRRPDLRVVAPDEPEPA